MKPPRMFASVVAALAVCACASATNFAVLLGGGGDGKKSGDAKSESWIEVENIAWTSRKPKTATSVEAPAPGSTDKKVRAYEPVVLSVPVGKQPAALKKAFKKGSKLGTIRLRDGDRFLVLHDVVVADVSKSGDFETISLNYSKIENANVPERARARMEGDPGHPAVTKKPADANPGSGNPPN